MPIPDSPIDRQLGFVFRGDELLVKKHEDLFSIPSVGDLILAGFVEDPIRCFETPGAEDSCTFVSPSRFSPPEYMTFVGLRRLFGTLRDAHFSLAGKAMQLFHWDRTNRYCGRCAAPMTDKADEVAKHCPECGFLTYPRLSPAVIMTVERGSNILLARSPRFPGGMYSTLAGFVEPGETLEQAVKREVFEEVGITVSNPTYFGSQSWPFPHSLMIGFIAEATGGEIKMDPSEIEDAQWFSADRLPQLPSPMSIAYALIADFQKRNLPGSD